MSFLKRLGGGLLWLLLVFHLAVIIMIPNRESFLNSKLAPLFLPYSNELNLNVAWQFFSPDPGPATYLAAKISQDGNLIAEEWIPPERDEFTFRQFFNRRIATMRFISKDPERAKQVLIPYLCSKYETATNISIEKIVAGVPSLDAVREGHPLNDLSGQVAEFFAADDCDRGELVE